MFESGILEIVFPQFRSTGETSRVSDGGEMLHSIFFECFVDHFRTKGFFLRPSPFLLWTGVVI